MDTQGNAPQFTYETSPDGTQGRCRCLTCGWEDEWFPVSPFDPREALAAVWAAHPRCSPLQNCTACGGQGQTSTPFEYGSIKRCNVCLGTGKV